MKCPLMKVRWKAFDGAVQREFAEAQDCIGEDCAWWHDEKNCCSVKVIAKELSRIQVKGINVQVAR